MKEFFETEIMCVDREAIEKAESMGMKAAEIPEQWMKIIIDLRRVECIRENTDEEGNPQVTLYMGADSFTVNGEFKHVVKRWLEVHTQPPANWENLSYYENQEEAWNRVWAILQEEQNNPNQFAMWSTRAMGEFEIRKARPVRND